MLSLTAMADPAAHRSPIPDVRVIASAQRRRTVSARMVDGVIELRVPAWMPESERREWAARMRERLTRRMRRGPRDVDLAARAERLNQRHFGGALRPSSVGWAEQRRRWGSCATMTGSVRISSRAAKLPEWVLDYLLVHELAHLAEPDHGPRFWALVNRYPLTERARGYLMALDHAESQGEEPDADGDAVDG
jgi:predicted metal-dependent hydrolase